MSPIHHYQQELRGALSVGYSHPQSKQCLLSSEEDCASVGLSTFNIQSPLRSLNPHMSTEKHKPPSHTDGPFLYSA